MVDPLFGVTLAALLWCLYRLSRVGRRPPGCPPGPPTIPILGNLHQMPTKEPHLQFLEWAKVYGPIYSLMLGTKVMIVLSNGQVVKDLLDKKSSIYSSRPDLYIGQKLVSGDHRMLMMPYGPKWRLQRKISHNTLNINKAVAYVPYQEVENKQMLYDIMETPSQLLEHFRRFSSSLTTSIVYGFRWKSIQEPRLQKLFHLIDKYCEINATGGAALIDFFPLLQRLPAWLVPIKREAIQHHEIEKAEYLSLYLETKTAILEKSPSARPCACDDIVELQNSEGFSDDFAAYMSGTLFEGGSDTTSGELYGFAQAMLLYPDVQRKAQAEIDAVIGDDRLPGFDDMDKLPYIRACMRETLRWMPVAILGAVPHAVIEDDHYNGHVIPKGASVMLNIWAIHRDPNRYPNPSLFSPERYTGDTRNSADSAASADVSQRDHFGFGAGRRVCPGMHVADRSMFLAISTFLWAFDIKPKKGGDGEEVLPMQDVFIEGFGAIPVKFDAVVEPRSAKRADIVKMEWEKAREGLDDKGQFLRNPI